MVRKIAGVALVLLVAAAARVSEAQIASATMQPLATFGTNGWLAPGSNAYVTTDSTQRGLAFNPLTSNVVLPSRAGGTNVAILDGTTGAVSKTMDVTGIAGGTFPINGAGVGDDGAIYVGNLSTSTASNFKVYSWASEASAAAPTVAYDGSTGLTRIGDSFTAYGSGASTQFAAAGGTTTVNSNFYIGTVDGSNTGTAYTSVPGTTTASNDYRLSIAYVDADTIIGNQGGSARLTSFAGTATVDASIPLGGAAQRALDVVTVNSTPLLAVIDSNSSNVTIFDITNPATPVSLTSGNATTGTLTANGNGTGGLAWGNVIDNLDSTYTATLYAMNTNQGVQAFSVTMTAVPEPASWSMVFAAAGLGLAGLRRTGSFGRRT
jgi:hypothetical protein